MLTVGDRSWPLARPPKITGLMLDLIAADSQTDSTLPRQLHMARTLLDWVGGYLDEADAAEVLAGLRDETLDLVDVMDGCRAVIEVAAARPTSPPSG